MVFVTELKAKLAFLREKLPLLLEGRSDLQVFAKQEDFAKSFDVGPSTLSQYIRGTRDTSGDRLPPHFEAALGLRYGFGPPDVDTSLPDEDLAEALGRWFDENLAEWRGGDARAFAEAVTAKLDDIEPLPFSTPALREAIARIPRKRSRSDEMVDSAPPRMVRPSRMPGDEQPENYCEGLVSLVVTFPHGNNPDDGQLLLVSLNCNEDTFPDQETGDFITYSLRGARLRLVSKAVMANPLGWNHGAKAPVYLGTNRVKVEILSAPPANPLWRLSDLDAAPDGAAISSEEFGLLSGEIGPDDRVMLEVVLSDIAPRPQSDGLRRKVEGLSVNQLRVWENLLARAAIGGPVESASYVRVSQHRFGAR